MVSLGALRSDYSQITSWARRCHNKLNYTCLAVSSLWSATSGAMLAGAISSKTVLAVSITPLFLLSNWVIFPFKPLKVFSDDKASKWESICRVSCFAISFLLASSFILLSHRINSPLNEKAYSFSLNTHSYYLQGGLISLNLLSCYGLRQLMPSSKRAACISAARDVFQWFANVKTGICEILNQGQEIKIPTKEEVEESLTEAIKRLEKGNYLLQNQLQEVLNFLKNDSELVDSFSICARKTHDILLPPARRYCPPPLDSPLIDKWREAMLEAHYLEKIKLRICDFLEKNPDFLQLVKDKIRQENLFPNKRIDWI